MSLRAALRTLPLLSACALLFTLVPGCPEGGADGEICGDGIDNDNDGAVDEGQDADGDGYLTCDIATLIDCNDDDPDVHPEQVDACNGEDTNCDGLVDNVDADLDTYIDSGCGGTDCDDSDPDANPASVESCDAADNDCDGEVDEGFDADDDGWTFCAGDCRDSDPGINPDAVEVCDHLDNNCNNKIDEDFDSDGDGYIDADDPFCSQLYGPGGAYADEGDCNDDDRSFRPGAHEDPTDNVDNDCDTCVDECEDVDGDGFDNCEVGADGDAQCAHAPLSDDGREADCVDVDSSTADLNDPDFLEFLNTTIINPGVCFTVTFMDGSTQQRSEQCDDVDNDCDGLIDEGFDEGCNPVEGSSDPCAN